ncbi:hypothetical protein TRVA0_012S02850 [Trichomonascus vanleenenianus]|uniref:uncharacterized protein n=1 Tax=Trichomonascus vanleenenianus TaxID=2268995 RepID=UPI003ECAF64C
MFLTTVSYFNDHEKRMDKTQRALRRSEQPIANMKELYVDLADRVQSELREALTEHEKVIKEQTDKTEKVLQEQEKDEQQHKVDEEQRKKELEEFMKKLQKQQGNAMLNDKQKKKEEEVRKKKEEDKQEGEKYEEKEGEKKEGEVGREEEQEEQEEQEEYVARNEINEALTAEYHQDEVQRETELLKPHNFSKEDYINGKLEPSGKKIVIISSCDHDFNKTQLEQVIANRDEYANYHGYDHVFIDSSVYAVEGDEVSWNKPPAIREAFRRYKDAEWFWWLDVDAFIMNETIDLAEHILHPRVLAERLTYGRPIMNIYFEFVTRYPSRKEIDINNVDIVLTHDDRAWNAGSMFFRRSAWTELFLEVWDDRKFREAGFWQDDQSALTYMALEHPPFLYHFGQVPQRLMNAYHRWHWEYQDGDLAVHFPGSGKYDKNFYRIWQQYYDSRIRVPKEYQLEPHYKKEKRRAEEERIEQTRGEREEEGAEEK